MMTEEALQLLIDTAKLSSCANVLLTSGRQRFIAFGNGTREWVDVPPEPRKHVAGSLADIIELANRFAAEGAKPVVWYSETSVVLVIDDDGHRIDMATLTLAYSDIFSRVVRLKGAESWFDHPGFMSLLRKDLMGCIEPVHLLERVKKVKFTQSDVRQSDIQPGKKSSYSQDILASSEGLDLPDDVALMVPVYKTFGQRDRFQFNCSVDVDLNHGRFQLLPFPDEIERVGQLAIKDIAIRLNEELKDVPAYYGRPS